VTSGRSRLATVLTGLALAATIGIVPSGPAQAAPDIDDVKAKVDTLYREAEQASERYNDARIELSDLRDDLDSLEADQQRQDERLSVVRDDVRDSVLREVTGEGSLSAFGQVVTSDDPQAFLSDVSTMSAYDDMQDGLFDDFRTEAKALALRQDATSARVDEVAATEKRLKSEKATVDEKLGDAKALLDRLEKEEREAIAAPATPAAEAGTEEAPAAAPASGRAGAAVSYALAQVGDAYVYGAAGPDAFDCSGLTMMAWAQAGVGLAHSSSVQSGSGTPVSSDALQPGDLVFYYSPISHVGMYIGNGQIVHAANPSSGVTTAPVFSMPYSGAVRPG